MKGGRTVLRNCMSHKKKKLYESRLSYFNDKARINYSKHLSVHQHGGPSRPRQNYHSCIFETKENLNLTIRIQYLGHHSKTTCQKSAKSMRYRVRPKFEFYRKSLLKGHSQLCDRADLDTTFVRFEKSLPQPKIK